MHAAPPAECRVARRGPWHWAAVGLPGLSLAAGLTAVWPEALPSATAAALALGAALAMRRTRQPAARLVWTGRVWRLDADELRGAELVWDLGRWLLVRAPRAGQARWLGLDARDAASPAAWHALRVALYASARSPEAGR